MTATSISTASTAKNIAGDKRVKLFCYLMAVIMHLGILIYLNLKVIETGATQTKEEEQLILVKNMPTVERKIEQPAVAKVTTKTDTKELESKKMIDTQQLNKELLGNKNAGGGGGGGTVMIDGKMVDPDEIKVDNSHLLKNMTLEDMQKFMPDKGEQENVVTKELPKTKSITRAKANQPVIMIKKGYSFGVKGGKGTVRSFESALRAGVFGKPTGTGTGIGSGTGSGYGPGSGGGWGGGSGGGIGDGIGGGWEGGVVGNGSVDSVVKSERIIKTTVRVFVLPDGSVDKVDLLKSSGFVELDNLAMDNAKRSNYDPLELKPGDEEKMRIYDVEIEFSQIK